MVKRGKRGENEKEDMRNDGWVWWRESRRRMGRGKLLIGVWMRKNGLEREVNSWNTREKNRGTTKLYKISSYEREFHKIYINRRKERIVRPLKGCVSSRGATFLGEILVPLEGISRRPICQDEMVPCGGF